MFTSIGVPCAYRTRRFSVQHHFPKSIRNAIRRLHWARRWALSIAATMSCISLATAQDLPAKPVRILTAQPGSSVDIAARLLAQGLSGPLGQSIVVDNRPGVIPVELAAKAAPDGATLLFFGGDVWLSPLLKDNVSWDPLTDFLPITLASKSPLILVVHPALPVKSVKDLITLAKARPGELSFGTSGTGGAAHLAGELFKSTAGLNMLAVNYKGSPAAVADLLGGRLHLMFPPVGSVWAHVKNGKLRALAITSAQPTALAPGLPTVSETLPGFESSSALGIFVPAKTPAAITARLNREIVRFLQSPEVKEKLFGAGLEVVASSADEFSTTIKSEVAKWGKVIKAAGIRAE